MAEVISSCSEATTTSAIPNAERVTPPTADEAQGEIEHASSVDGFVSTQLLSANTLPSTELHVTVLERMPAVPHAAEEQADHSPVCHDGGEEHEDPLYPEVQVHSPAAPHVPWLPQSTPAH